MKTYQISIRLTSTADGAELPEDSRRRFTCRSTEEDLDKNIKAYCELEGIKNYVVLGKRALATREPVICY